MGLATAKNCLFPRQTRWREYGIHFIFTALQLGRLDRFSPPQQWVPCTVDSQTIVDGAEADGIMGPAALNNLKGAPV